MTKQPPSAEAMRLASRYADGEVKKCAAAIDALIAQRVAAETERWQHRDRQRLEQIDRLQATVQSAQSAQAERPAPSAVVDYTEWALTVARDAIEGVPSHLLPYRINSEEIAQAIAPDIADALSTVASERDAAAIRAFGQRVWSDTEEVAYQAGVSDTLERLREPEVRNALRDTLRDAICSARREYTLADAALTKIAEMLK